MKIATKISAGYAILIALIIAVLTYQVSLFNQMQSINQNLTGIDFRAAIVALQLLRDQDLVEEFTRKFFATGGDPDYGAQIDEMRGAYSEGLQELRSLRVSPVERQEVDRLAAIWSSIGELSSAHQRDYKSLKPEDVNSALLAQEELFSQLRVQAQSVIRATRTAIETQVQRSSDAGRHAQKVSWIAAAVASLLSVIVSFWIIRSISVALRHLTEGTRAVAQGKFFYQLDSSSNDELAELARDFNVMTRRLGELDEMKKDFVSHVSHELKTPLASIQETISLLLEEIPGPLNEQQKRFLELNLQGSKRLSALIRNLLDLSRMDAGVMHYELGRNDLAQLIRTVVAEFEAPLRERRFTACADLPDHAVWVSCDRDRVIQVLGNLLGNAMKFAPAGSEIRIKLETPLQLPPDLPADLRKKFSGTPPPEQYALISVADRGPGIPAAEREKIFEKFYQVRKAHKMSGQGAGLGLAIGKTIVEAHGGAIWVHDNPEGGSIFNVLFAAGSVPETAPVRTSMPI
jgi:signal transduction histidine kinase